MQVSGQMKTFLDRISSWYHLMELAGKGGITAATTAGSGLEEVHNYLGRIFCATGVKVIANIGMYGTFSQPIMDYKETEKKALKTAEEVYPYITGQKQIETDENLERCFKTRKFIVTAYAKSFPGHYDYWKKKGMLEFNSFAELLENRKISKDYVHPISVTFKITISIDNPQKP